MTFLGVAGFHSPLPQLAKVLFETFRFHRGHHRQRRGLSIEGWTCEPRKNNKFTFHYTAWKTWEGIIFLGNWILLVLGVKLMMSETSLATASSNSSSKVVGTM